MNYLRWLDGIQEFARARFESTTTLRESAAERDEKGNLKYNNPERDIFWQDKLIEVKNFFLRDPIALATIYKYFPKLYELFIVALSASADYGYSEEDALNNQKQIVQEMFKSFGVDKDGKSQFEPVWAAENFITAMQIEQTIKKISWPSGTAPQSPDAFHLRIGASNFYVPPIAISVNTGFKAGSLTGGAIRQKASPKFNAGYKQTTVSLKLFFPNYEEIWGITAQDAVTMNLKSNINIDFNDPKQELKVDKFLSSLRGLIAAFKYAPILPIKNQYLNSVFDITGIAMSNISISTVPNFPFAIAVDLQLNVFNHKPFLPMIKDFNQAIDWGKFRYYMGRAAIALSETANEEFLLVQEEDTDTKAELAKMPVPISTNYADYTDGAGSLSSSTLSMNIADEWSNGNSIEFYIPSQIQSKLFSPDISTFRSEEERNLTDIGRGFWEGILKKVGIDISEAALYRNLDTVVQLSQDFNVSTYKKKIAKQIVEVVLAGANSSNVFDKVYDAIAIDYLNSNGINASPEYNYIKSNKSPNDLEVPAQPSEEETQKLKDDKWMIYLLAKEPKGYLAYSINNAADKQAKLLKPPITDRSSVQWKNIRGKLEREYADAFNVSLYERYFSDSSIQAIFEASANKKGGKFNIKEWEVPMMKVRLDHESIVVNSVSTTLSNNLARMQLQMQDEPTFQYIGCNDSFVSMSLTIFGEKELTKITKMFDFLSGLARLEQAAGVIGFMGIKNILTALSGIKYVLPLSYSVDTIPSFPHVYNVQLSFVDFDIFQQKREAISSESQIELVKEFGTKRNPFLRLKQKWSSINTYPDMPLAIMDEQTNKHIGSFDPDFYFRSFEMFDNDVINNVVDNYDLPGVENGLLNKSGATTTAEYISIVNQVKEMLIGNKGNLNDVKDYLLKEKSFNSYEAMKVFRIAIFDTNNDTLVEKQGLGDNVSISNKYPDLWQDMVEKFKDDEDTLYDFGDLKFATKDGDIKIGELLSGSKEQIEAFNKLVLAGERNVDGVSEVSFDPDDSEHFGITHYIPAANSESLGKIPAIYQTPDGGYIFGHSNNADGKFYIANENIERNFNTKKVTGINTSKIIDTTCLDNDPQESHTGVPGAKSLNGYMTTIANPEADKMEAGSNSSQKSIGKHWQKMMMDSQYRDISGRMLRAFPTYMLWLIDDSNFFAGVKLFDNFFGLQSVIDFSIVQSEDILGDTLVLRLSNTYSKLSKPEMTVSSLLTDGQVYNIDKPDLTSGTSEIVDKLLNRSFNLKSNMNSSYIVQINNMRIKPGIRIHLRAGYGANPNSLQTVFNGIITEVETGEIITIICQSDAIELSPIINSVNKKGDSGKIDGGANTGLWMSEPRDLMIRLLSMGASRTREAFAHATRGAVFSENKFGIRHFGSILYEPLTAAEAAKSQAYKQSVMNAFNAVGNNPVTGTVGLLGNSAMNIMTGGLQAGVNTLTPGRPFGSVGGMQSAGGSVRTPVVGAMQALWSNFSTQRDLEIFKRNIYPGNGIGVAQFLGGDLDDGWTTMASIDETKMMDEKFGYLDRLSGSSWSNLIQDSTTSTDASAVLEAKQSGLNSVPIQGEGSSRSNGPAKTLAGAVALTRLGPAGSVLGVAMLGSNLLHTFKGRGFKSLFATMGLTNNTDDDLYDEVSFRAQTYMRSVWDMFQMCARLLPNYIVAVRPFEDRSTIFYGKPHWLYTSGVVPISTGFPSEEQAQKDGVNIPGYSPAESDMRDILSKINKETSPLGDAAAALALKESTISEDLATYARQMANFSGIFEAGSAKGLGGQLINLNDEKRLEYYEKKNVVSKIPKLEGKTQVGFHLPFGANSGIIMGIQEDHQQVGQLPIRFRYPFFADRTSGTLQSLDFDRIIKINSLDDVEERMANIVGISLTEKDLLNQEGTSGDTALVTKKDDVKSLDFNFSFANKLKFMGLDEMLKNSAAFDPSGFSIEGLNTVAASQIITMPLPVFRPGSGTDVTVTSGGIKISESYKDYYKDLDPAYEDSYDRNTGLTFEEWGMPIDALHEQFYIAMKWPYKAGEDGSKAREAFKKAYNFSDNDLAGKPEDYKKRKVLVYNQRTRQAVVCAPAYFLWGYGEGTDIDAIISPDAAYFLGLLIDDNGRIIFPSETLSDRLSEDSAMIADAEKQYETVGAIGRVLENCRFTFVRDDTPLGVVTTSVNQAKDFHLKGERSSNEMIVGFGSFRDRSNTVDQTSTEATELSAIRNNFTDDNSEGTGIVPSYVYSISDALAIRTVAEMQQALRGGGNVTGYFNNIQSGDLDHLDQDTLQDLRKQDQKAERKKDKNGDEYWARAYNNFASIYDIVDNTSVQARSMFDEKFDSEVSVIAGNGRTVGEAQTIWDQFRYGYHNYTSVKNIWRAIYNLDPDDNEESDDLLFGLIRGKTDKFLQDFNLIGSGGRSKEFETLLGADWVNKNSSRKEAVDIAINEYVNKGFDGYDEDLKPKFNEGKGLTDAYNALIYKKVAGIRATVKQYVNMYLYGEKMTANAQATSTTSPTATTKTTPSSVAELSNMIVPIATNYTNFNLETQVTEDQIEAYLAEIKTPKQLFLLMVGVFRQKMWQDPYARAWLVLRPDKKRVGATGARIGAAVATLGATEAQRAVGNAVVDGAGTASATATSVASATAVVGTVAGAALEAVGSWAFGGDDDDWSFRPVDVIWQAFIDYEVNYASDSGAFTKLLQKHAKEGNSASNYFTGLKEDITNFWDRNIGPIYNAFTSSLGGLLNMFQLSMQQMGYGLSQLENFSQQANILNKAYNDSIYYSLGRPDTLLRAVDNPFTREYGEPVVEVREPFQRIHYISSFTHILSNTIKENIGNVATQITAVSDGKYPVTVALDKAAPPERQVEKTVETGIFFDNLKGSGITGILHPIMHPMETFRGIAKSASGEPDELTAKRVALSHLKESLKDIYGGELMVIGNADIRPFDLVYLADVYERMYGIFEVEQVVHHFTPQMGFVTSITPNAFVTVNDPSRWFMSSWISGHFSMQDLRNSSRFLLGNPSSNSLLTTNGDVSVESLSQSLKTQLTGAMQYTHGHSALIKDIMANQSAEQLPDAKERLDALSKLNTGRQDGSMGMAILSAAVMPVVTAGVVAVAAIGSGGLAAGIAGGAMTLVNDGIWNGWKTIRDNVLDQHGCYIQYLNKNGQPMDAGLSFNQGMVVGRYHSIKILPGILGVRSNTRSAEGNLYIRSDDLLKSMGWKEKEITNLVRHISLENAIVHSQILKYSGIGPDKTGFNESFKAIVKVTYVKDGDTFEVQDVIYGTGVNNNKYTVRFDGINAAELVKFGIGSTSDATPSQTAFINENSSAGQAMKYVQEAVKGRLIVLRINPKDPSKIITVDNAYEPGSEQNIPGNYTSAYKAASYANAEDRYMATVFSTTDSNIYENLIQELRKIFIAEKNTQFLTDFKETTKENVRKRFYQDSVMFINFSKVYASLDGMTDLLQHFVQTGNSDPLASMSLEEIKHFNVLMNILITNELYEKASEWPVVSWDEYYEDGKPVTLNWELIASGLAQVYMTGTQYQQKSVETPQDYMAQLNPVSEYTVGGGGKYVR